MAQWIGKSESCILMKEHGLPLCMRGNYDDAIPFILNKYKKEFKNRLYQQENLKEEWFLKVWYKSKCYEVCDKGSFFHSIFLQADRL